MITNLAHGKETVKNEDITTALLPYNMRKKNAVEVSHGEGLQVKGEEWRKGYEAGKNKKKKEYTVSQV